MGLYYLRKELALTVENQDESCLLGQCFLNYEKGV